MMGTDNGFHTLVDLGTIMGHEVGRPSFAGYVPMTPEDIQALYEDEHAFEKVLKAMADGRPYHYMLIMQSYGPSYGEEVDRDRWTDASGPLHVYERLSTMPADHWNFWTITDNDDEPMRGSQSYTINTWWQAPSMHWRWQECRDYTRHPYFAGWAIPKEMPMPVYIPPPSAPPPIDAVAVAPTPILMSPSVAAPYSQMQDEDDQQPRCSMQACCPKFGS